ncbi:DNA polymerase III subunit delta', partial [Pseudoalteromonas sp. SIMBA_162]
EAANALFKKIEEPSNSRFLILHTSKPAQSPATILSRCATTDLKVTSTQLAQQWLESLQRQNYPWRPLFYSQPLQVKQWQE